MSFITTIPDADINDDVRAMYDRQAGFWGFVPNYAKVFCYRPEIMRLWAQLQAGIKQNVDKRRFELVTFAAATALRSTLCSLAHGKTLTQFLPAPDVMAIAKGDTPAGLPAAEAEMLSFARQVATDASAVTRDDVERLKQHGFTDAEIFDIAAIAGARAFWTKLVEALGVEAEPNLRAMDAEFVASMSVGRAVQPVVKAIDMLSPIRCA
jgi:uncharacterized peroxidase-related enzyme